MLSERCEQLVKEMREMDSKYKHKIKTMEERWAGLLLIVLMNDLLNMEERWAGCSLLC